MVIHTQETPNPDSLQFFPGQVLVEGDTFFFTLNDDLSSCPLAERLLSIEGAWAIFIGFDFVTVTKKPEASWDTLKPEVLSEFYDHIIQDKPIINICAPQHSTQEETELVREIRALIDARVRPAVAMDGGDIVFKKFDDGIVYVQLKGACSGCPSSLVTLKQGIEKMLKYYIPEVKSVEAVS